MKRLSTLRAVLALAALAAVRTALAQTAPAPAPPTPAPAPAAAAQQIEITGGRENDAEQRRQSTAAKIVIGRDEIDRFGDSTLGEVLRRLPGVTTPGPPGRGGPPRLRGLGGGYTQILIDGQRTPAGFSLESLTPEQVERIEILRAPTAETGARAIAGTINIVTREGFKRRINDLRLGVAVENGEVSPGLHWTHNDSSGPLTYNLSGSVSRTNRRSSSITQTDIDADGTENDVQRSESAESRDERQGLNFTSRLQWRLGEAGDLLMLTPSLFTSRSEGRRSSVLSQTGSPAPPYDTSASEVDSGYTAARLNGQWRQRVGASRVEWNGSVNGWRSESRTRRDEFSGGALTRELDEDRRTRERSGSLSAKLSRLVGGNGAVPGSEHSLVSGAELESAQRAETRSVSGNGALDEGDGGDNLQAANLRLAAYVQDEWQLSPQWAVNAGLRWEGITTRGENVDGSRPTNQSSVWTPLLHAVWKPDPKSRDQIRISLTRSYRSPGLGSLIAQRSINNRFPADGPNEPLSPDRVGNPDLRPELATGIDLAAERYLDGGGVLSANLFHRRIQDLMRTVTTEQTVDWSPVPRWVAQEQNIGNASTQGLELEAKFRLDQVLDDAPRVDLRSNLSLYRSQVDGVPGPDNRLDQQAGVTFNVGADYRFRGVPLQLGGNLNWVPGYRTQLSGDRSVSVGTKSVFDAYGLWTFSPGVALRLLASNLSARDYQNDSLFDGVDGNDKPYRESASTLSPSDINWQLRLELKL